ncbi:unnamed protein product [Parnassius apollo]|uniref:(apollo) hypothetical protein n=1 Tax=Parnassius apollo TaxID=110799 RepID=A0A8S3X4Z1_PARAO|nr:unnamed protein product [Parnassius apollo]
MKSMKAGKAAGYDRVSLEMLRAGEGVVAGLLYTLFNLCWELKRVPDDWCKAVIVPIYKGKGSQQDCKNYRGISLLSIVGKLYAKVLIERVMKETDGKIWDVQAGFRKGMGCTDQVFSMRMIAEKFLTKNQKVFCAFMDLEKAYDRVDRNVLWQTLNSYGLSAGLIQALRSLYRNSSACVRINGVYSDWFGIRKGVSQGCVASPWLFNLFMDSCLQTLKDEECGLRMGELTVKCLLYADDQVIFASSAAELQMMVTSMNWALKERGIKVNASKTKVMVFEREESKTVCEIRIEGELIEQVDEFVSLGCVFSRDGRYDKDIERRVNAGNRVNGALHSIVKNQNVSKKARMVMARYKCKGIRGNWVEDDMKFAMSAVKRGVMRVNTAAKRFNVPRRTLRRYLAENKNTKSTLGRKPLLNSDQENDLKSRIIRLCSVGYPLTQRVLRSCVKTFCNEHNILSKSQGVMIGRDWLRRFLRRHPNISKRKAQNLNPARTQKLNKAVVSDYFAKLKDLMKK